LLLQGKRGLFQLAGLVRIEVVAFALVQDFFQVGKRARRPVIGNGRRG